ncbi:MAG: ribbon-helix-helix protein, CopG family [Anaerolineales bacterium]|jgi:hypothetical protein
MNNRKDALLSLRIDRHTLATLEKMAAAEDRSRGSVVRRLIRQGVESGGVQKGSPAARRKERPGVSDG